MSERSIAESASERAEYDRAVLNMSLRADTLTHGAVDIDSAASAMDSRASAGIARTVQETNDLLHLLSTQGSYVRGAASRKSRDLQKLADDAGEMADTNAKQLAAIAAMGPNLHTAAFGAAALGNFEFPSSLQAAWPVAADDVPDAFTSLRSFESRRFRDLPLERVTSVAMHAVEPSNFAHAATLQFGYNPEEDDTPAKAAKLAEFARFLRSTITVDDIHVELQGVHLKASTAGTLRPPIQVQSSLPVPIDIKPFKPGTFYIRFHWTGPQPQYSHIEVRVTVLGQLAWIGAIFTETHDAIVVSDANVLPCADAALRKGMFDDNGDIVVYASDGNMRLWFRHVVDGNHLAGGINMEAQSPVRFVKLLSSDEASLAFGDAAGVAAPAFAMLFGVQHLTDANTVRMKVFSPGRLLKSLGTITLPDAAFAPTADWRVAHGVLFVLCAPARLIVSHCTGGGMSDMSLEAEGLLGGNIAQVERRGDVLHVSTFAYTNQKLRHVLWTYDIASRTLNGTRGQVPAYSSILFPSDLVAIQYVHVVNASRLVIVAGGLQTATMYVYNTSARTCTAICTVADSADHMLTYGWDERKQTLRVLRMTLDIADDGTCTCFASVLRGLPE